MLLDAHATTLLKEMVTQHTVGTTACCQQAAVQPQNISVAEANVLAAARSTVPCSRCSAVMVSTPCSKPDTTIDH
jgi:hypothetical protein